MPNLLTEALGNILQYFRSGASPALKVGRGLIADQYAQKPQASPSDYQAPQVPTATQNYQQPPEPNAWEMMGRPASNPYSNQVQEAFGPELAPQAEQVLRWGTPSYGGKYGVDYGGENLGYQPDYIGYNENGTRDKGLFQINSGTYDDLVNRLGETIRGLGINSYEDLNDPKLNALMAKMIYDQQGWGAFYGAPPELRGR